MVNWILISILAAFVGVDSHTIVYPGKSALLSYSPARGEFPVESLFGRGFFSYIDNQGISRTINLEPNPLLGVRVSNEGKLSTDSGDTTDLRKEGSSSSIEKGNRLKPIKEFDERPFEDSLAQQENGSGSPLESGTKLIEGSQQQMKGDKLYDEQILSVTVPKQQEQILFYPATGNVPVQNLGLQSGANVYFTSQNTGKPIVSNPSPQAVFSSENPFLNKQLGVLVQNPSTVGDLAAVKQTVPAQLQPQVTFYPQTSSSTGQLLLLAPKLTNSVLQNPSLRKLQDVNSAESLAKQEIPSTASTPIMSPYLDTQTPGMVLTPESVENQFMRQTLPSTSAASFHGASSTVGIPNSETLISGNPSFPPSRQPPPPKHQEVFMVPQTNPFLLMSNNKNEQLAWPTISPSTTTTTSSGPLFNAEQNNPFLPLGNQEVPIIKIQPIPMQPSLQLEPVKPESTVCDYLSVGPIPEQIKDTPEVEKAKREHFLAHQKALAQLAEARQNKDNMENQTNDSSLNSDNSASYLTANSPLDSTVTSGPTTAFEQTTPTVNNAESEIFNAKALPL